MEIKLVQGDYVPDGLGGIQRCKGRDALLQRILYRLTARADNGEDLWLTASLLFNHQLGRGAEVRVYRLGTRAELELTEQPTPDGQPRLTLLP